jgi:ABC-2 type transport system permease protein
MQTKNFSKQITTVLKTILKATIAFLNNIVTIVQFETIKIIRAPSELLIRSIQPALWLVLFGQVFTKIKIAIPGGYSYVAFIAPGILAQSVLFIAIFYGIGTIWERDLGILHKVLVSPCSRVAIMFGKGISAGLRAVSQLLVVLLLTFFLHIKLCYAPIVLLKVVAFIMLEATIYALFSLIIACMVKTRERFLGIGQIITMPMFFASNAIYPINIMPHWLQIISHWNPLTYQVDALRSLLLTSYPSTFGLATDFWALFSILMILVAIGSWIYPKIVQ